MREIVSIGQLPNIPSIYAMCGGRGRGAYVAYVGIADKLRQRVIQHLVRRDSSVATGTSAAVLNPDYVTEVRWWESPEFSERHVLEAAELVAFEILDPALRSRAGSGFQLTFLAVGSRVWAIQPASGQDPTEYLSAPLPS